MVASPPTGNGLSTVCIIPPSLSQTSKICVSFNQLVPQGCPPPSGMELNHIIYPDLSSSYFVDYNYYTQLFYNFNQINLKIFKKVGNSGKQIYIHLSVNKNFGGLNMSDLAATNCGCGCGCETGGNSGCNSIFLILILLCCCGGFGEHNNCGGGCGGCGGGFGGGCDFIWIILLLCFCGGNGFC